MRVNGKWEQLPAIMRRRSKTDIYESYLAQVKADPDRSAISRSSFFRIISTIATGEKKKSARATGALGFLVEDSFELLQRIIVTLTTESESSQQLLEEMELVRAYLKSGFDSHVQKESHSCVLQDLQYGLTSTIADEQGQQPQALCVDCARMFAFFKHVKNLAVRAKSPASVLRTVEACSEKARLYMAYRLRVLNQQRTIEAVADAMRDRCLAIKGSDEAVVVLDFKRKFDPQSDPEKSQQKNRGMSWHCALVQYWEYQDCPATASSVAVKQKLFFDHVSSSDTIQDRECVLSMIEAVLIRLRKDLPHIKRIVLQSSNAPCYQNLLSPLLLPFLSVAHGIEVVRFIHTESHEAQRALDNHFAKVMQALKAWIEAGNSCVTPTQTIIGLSAHGGLPNTVMELVTYDQNQLKTLVMVAASMEQQLKKYVAWANDIVIIFSDNSWRNSTVSMDKYWRCPSFELHMLGFSGVGDCATFECSPSTSHCALKSDSASQASGGEPDTGCFEEVDDGTADWIGQVDDPDESEWEDEDQESDIVGQAEEPDEIQMSMGQGSVTGVAIATQGQIRKRVRRVKQWNAPTAAEPTDAEPGSLDVASFVLRQLLQMHARGDLNSTMQAGLSDPVIEVPHTFQPGWASHLKQHGLSDEQPYMRAYRKIIRELLVGGQNKKISPNIMRLELLARFPERSDIPTESEILEEINGQSTLPVGSGKASTRRKEYADFFIQLVEANPSIKPFRAVLLFKQEFASSGLNDQQIRNKFYNSKPSATIEQ